MEWDPIQVVDDAATLAVLAVSDPQAAAAIQVHAERAGYRVAATLGRGLDVIEHLAVMKADLVVIELPLLGSLGFRLLSVIRLLQPDCLVVLLDPLGSSEDAGVGAGADVVVGTGDLSRLRAVLRERERPSTGGPVDQSVASEFSGSRKTN